MPTEEGSKTEAKLNFAEISDQARILHNKARDFLIKNPDFVKAAAGSFWRKTNQAEFEKDGMNHGVTYESDEFGSRRTLVIIRRDPEYLRYATPYEILRIESGPSNSEDDRVKYTNYDSFRKPPKIEFENTALAIAKAQEFLERLK